MPSNTFTGLMTFSNSVLENIGSASAYRVMIICLFIGLVFFNVIGVLLFGIKSIVYWRVPKSSVADGRREWRKWISENAIWVFANVVLVCMIAGVLFMWETSSEKKIQDLGVQKYMKDLHIDIESAISENTIED